MMLTAPDGTSREFALSIERIIEMEQVDPSWSLMSALSSLSSGRVTDADTVLRMVGTTYAEFVADGFTYLDVGKVLQGILAETGFTMPSAGGSGAP